jgi:hypothetical protein
VKLYARTPSGRGLGISVRFTGQVKESDNTIRSVEITLPRGCDEVVGLRVGAEIVGYRVEALPKAPSGDPILWADPDDLCADDGSAVNQEQLRAEVIRVNDQRRADMLRGPLGEDWP